MRFRRRKKVLADKEQYLITGMTIEEDLKEITKCIIKLRKLFKRVEMLEMYEEYAKGGEDKTAGRNRLRLSYGRE